MNDTLESKTPMPGEAGRTDANPPAKRTSRWRVVARVLVTSVIGFVALATVYQMFFAPMPGDGSHEWTLRWPGTPPGAKFSTEPGDDARRLLEILIVDAQANWQVPLAEHGTVEVQLSHPAYPSLWTILKWRFGLLKGPVTLAAQRTLVIVRINAVAKDPPRYELVRIKPGGAEAVSGPFDDYHEAEKAALDVLSQAMDDYQT